MHGIEIFSFASRAEKMLTVVVARDKEDFAIENILN
jgi:hypothetical protein